MIVWGPQELLWSFINTRLGIPWSSDFRALGLVKNDCLCAVVAYNAFTGRSCYAHIAIDNPSSIDRTFVREAFSYVFDVCGVIYLLATAQASSPSSIDQNKRLGFVEIDRLPGTCLDGSDMLLLRMSRNECKWLTHGK